MLLAVLPVRVSSGLSQESPWAAVWGGMGEMGGWHGAEDGSHPSTLCCSSAPLLQVHSSFSFLEVRDITVREPSVVSGTAGGPHGAHRAGDKHGCSPGCDGCSCSVGTR